MANRKAGSGDGGTGGAKRSAAGKKGTGAAAGDAAQAASGEETAGAKKRSARITSAAGENAGAAAESQPSRAAKRAPRSAAGAGEGAAGGAGDGDAGGGKGAGKGAAKGSARGASRKGGGTGGADLQSDLRQFVSDNPNGWGHSQWEGLLAQLGQRGHDTSNANQIGMQLERERLSSRLQGIEGVSPQKARSIVDRYGALYNLRGADVDEIAREAKVSRDVAERIKQRLG